MPDPATYATGSFCWADLASSDVDSSKRFYKDLFGWDSIDTSHASGRSYWAFTLGGKEVAGVFPLSAHEREIGRPAGWSTYIEIDRVGETAQRAQALGGRILAGPHPAGDRAGEYARIVDPSGAIFVLWKAAQQTGAQVYGEINTLCWFELASTDVAASETFYSSLFGWSARPRPDGYREWFNADRSIGGLVAQEVESRVTPSHWLPYIRVANADASMTTASLLGASVASPLRHIEGVGSVAAFRDPGGAKLSIVEFT